MLLSLQAYLVMAGIEKLPNVTVIYSPRFDTSPFQLVLLND